jgi:hypothetical protein
MLPMSASLWWWIHSPRGGWMVDVVGYGNMFGVVADVVGG